MPLKSALSCPCHIHYPELPGGCQKFCHPGEDCGFVGQGWKFMTQCLAQNGGEMCDDV